jgi:hypothetical protein
MSIPVWHHWHSLHSGQTSICNGHTFISNDPTSLPNRTHPTWWPQISSYCPHSPTKWPNTTLSWPPTLFWWPHSDFHWINRALLWPHSPPPVWSQTPFLWLYALLWQPQTPPWDTILFPGDHTGFPYQTLSGFHTPPWAPTPLPVDQTPHHIRGLWPQTPLVWPHTLSGQCHSLPSGHIHHPPHPCPWLHGSTPVLAALHSRVWPHTPPHCCQTTLHWPHPSILVTSHTFLLASQPYLGASNPPCWTYIHPFHMAPHPSLVVSHIPRWHHSSPQWPHILPRPTTLPCWP